jgi:dTDP-4-amino-4,6-dideoxygalactose transaminase
MDNIFVTKPAMPPIDELIPELMDIWNSGVMTNGGKYHQLLEKKMTEYLKIPTISLFTNGTIALITALQTLKVTGEVITTPYSFVATAHSLLWNNNIPVFVDVDPNTCNIDPKKIEQAITPKTTAILAVHCYGIPCDVESIQSIADTYGLHVIYDAAHAFGVELNGSSILNNGDLSVLSFHATKVYNTLEGGAIISHNNKIKKRVDFLKNFGFSDEITVTAPGINGKMSEMNAAIGLLQLDRIQNYIDAREKIAKNYNNEFNNIDGINLLSVPANLKWNYSYYPIFFNENSLVDRDYVYSRMKEDNIFTRRYFFPLISEFPMYKCLESSGYKNLINSYKISRNVLCLPIYPDLKENEQLRVIEKIKGFF